MDEVNGSWLPPQHDLDHQKRRKKYDVLLDLGMFGLVLVWATDWRLAASAARKILLHFAVGTRPTHFGLVLVRWVAWPAVPLMEQHGAFKWSRGNCWRSFSWP